MRDYTGKIRSVIMESSLPLEASFNEENVNNLLESLDNLRTDCESSTGCNNTFPDLKSCFLRYLEDKTRNPLIIKVETPNNGQIETFYLKGKDLVNVFS